MSLYVAAGSLIVGSFLVGREIGRHNSPDYTKESSAYIFMTTHMRVVSSDADDVRLALPAGVHTYEYTLSSNTVTRVARPAFEVTNLPIKKRWALLEDRRMAEFAGIAITLPAAHGILSKISTATQRLTPGPRIGLYVVGAMTLGTGGIAGYFTTYDDAADYDNEIFRKTLLDATNWHTTARLMKTCRITRRVHEAISEVELLEDGARETPSVSPTRSDAMTGMLKTCGEMEAWVAKHL
jgi:hypothetical protein